MASGSEFMCRKKVDTHRYFYWGFTVQTELGNHLNMTVSQIQWLEYEYEKKINYWHSQSKNGYFFRKLLEYDLTLKREIKSDCDLNMTDYSQNCDYNFITLCLILFYNFLWIIKIKWAED